MTAKYICIEGTEGCYKTTNTRALADSLELMGYKVLQTKEPGTPHIPLTMELRNIMLDAKHEPHMTRQAREFVSQAIRSIHLSKLIVPALETYDYIIQDRGLLSGLAYGIACGNTGDAIADLTEYIIEDTLFADPARKARSPSWLTWEPTWSIYDKIIFLKGDTEKGLQLAQASKQEFAAGDAIESKGLGFMKQVDATFSKLIGDSDAVATIDVTAKTPQVILTEILAIVENI